ncbi:hypothetical protein [uncultured Gulosibacter sp.]|uniref:hypothetical protein n=1 Tax=uncultured Gulosibacter sp. TaxID=1339167 RepID=UPI0028895BCC|nr:hypothetical protein [uncultured Gulosibacter sp.]
MQSLSIIAGEFAALSARLDEVIAELGAALRISEAESYAQDSMPASQSAPKLSSVTGKIARELREFQSALSADSESLRASEADFAAVDELNSEALWRLVP